MKWLACCGASPKDNNKPPPSIDLNSVPIKMDINVPEKEADPKMVHVATPRYETPDAPPPTNDEPLPTNPLPNLSGTPGKTATPAPAPAVPQQDIDVSDDPQLAAWLDSQVTVASDKLKKVVVKAVAHSVKTEEEVTSSVSDALSKLSLAPTEPPSPSDVQLSVFHQQMTKLKQTYAGEEHVEPALKWIKKLDDIISQIVEPNKGTLEGELDNIMKEQMSSIADDMTKNQIQEKHVARKAGQVLKVVQAAIAEAFKQFKNAVLDACKKSSSMSKLAPKDIEPVCVDFINSKKDECMKKYTHAVVLEKLKEEIARIGGAVTVNKTTSLDDVPSALLEYIMHKAETPLKLSEQLHDWLQWEMAQFMDPYVDADVPHAAREQRNSSQQSVYDLLAIKYEEGWGSDMSEAITPEQVLLAYIGHGMHKMNTLHGFQPHMPGMSRQPVSQYAQFRHLKMLGQALVAGIARDFPEEDRMVDYTQVTAEMMQFAAEEHLKMLFKEEDERSTELAVANMLGEEARKAERMRLWGIST